MSSLLKQHYNYSPFSWL